MRQVAALYASVNLLHFLWQKCTKFANKTFYRYSLSSKRFQSYLQDGSTIFYEFSLNFVEISTKFADCQRYNFVVRNILKLFARWQHHILLQTIRNLFFAEKY